MSNAIGIPVAIEDPETLELFIEESLESLQRVERHLLDAEGGKPAHELMGVLFRDIHTIKGTSGFLALDRILRLAHVSEDLLARLRDKTLVARPEHFARLMTVVDLLRQMLQNLRERGTEGDVDVDALADQLRDDMDGTRAQAKNALLGALQADPDGLDHGQGADDHGRQDSAGRAENADSTVRVNVAVLDMLMNLIGELVLARNQMIQLVKSMRDTNAQAACQRLNLVTSDLQEQIMKTRMQPVARVFEKIPRMVRDLCKSTSKQVACQLEGTTTEIDKALVESIRDPVMHIVRNAIDHGIEAPDRRVAAGKSATGKLAVRAAHQGGMVTLEVEDDGRGMDPEKLKAHAIQKGILTNNDAAKLSDREALELVFRPGFSTAEKVTDISGRGVGMDVVRTHVERAGGQVELESVVGKGTVVRLKMPLTLAIIPALLVRSSGQRFAIPQVNLLELVYLNDEQAASAVEHVRGAAIYRLRGELLPLVRLDTVLRLGGRKAGATGGFNIVVVAVGERRYGLVVDRIDDTEEIVIKPLLGQLKRLTCYAGASVLGDGGVALIVDVAGIAAMAGIDMSARRSTAADGMQANQRSGPKPHIVFLAGGGVPCAVPLAMVARLEQIPAAAIEQVGGTEVVQYRQAIMPIVRPEAVLPLGTAAATGAEQPLIVFDFGQMVGMAVNQILDVVDIQLDLHEAETAAPFTLGKTVVFGKTTLLMDVYRVVRELAPQFVQERRRIARRPRLLLADDSNAMRAALGGYLRSRGLEVVDVTSGDAAIRELRATGRQPFDAIITDLEMSGTDGLGVLASAKTECPTVPVFVWTFHDEHDVAERVLAAGARACVHKLRREDLMVAMERHGVTFANRAEDQRTMP